MPLGIPVGKAAGRTYINTGTAELTTCFEQRVSEGLADTCFTTAIDEINNCFALVFFADSYTSAAENTKIEITIHEGLGTFHRALVVYGRNRQLRKAQIVGQNTHLADFLIVTGMTPGGAACFFRFGPVLFALLTPAAHKARAGMFEHHEGQNIPAQSL